MQARRWIGLLWGSGLGIAAIFWAMPARAASLWYVAPDGQDGNSCQTSAAPCATITAAIAKAAAGDEVRIALGTYVGTGSEVVTLDRPMTLSGGWTSDFSAQTGLSTIDGQGVRRGVRLTCPADQDPGLTTLSHLNVTAGFDRQWGGGALLDCPTARVWIVDSAFRENESGGAAIYSKGDLTVTRSEFAHNLARGYELVSGIYNFAGSLAVENSTFVAHNRAAIDSQALAKPTTILNSTFSDNAYGIRAVAGQIFIRDSVFERSAYADCVFAAGYPGQAIVQYSWLSSSNDGCTVDETDHVGLAGAGFGPLADHGGVTRTLAPQLISGVPDSGSPAGCLDLQGQPLTIDQRGAPRIGACTPGSYAPSFVLEKGATTYVAPGGAATFTLRLTNPMSVDLTGAVVTDTLPTGLSAIPGSETATQGAAVWVGNVLTWTGTLTSGSVVTISFQAQLDGGAGDQTILNTAQGSWSGFPVPDASAVIETAPRLRLPMVASQDCRPFEDEFDDPTSGWYTGDTATRLVEYVNGTYHVRTKQSGYLFLFGAPTCPGLNYRVETHAYWWGTDFGSDLGLYFGADSGLSRFYLFDINTRSRQFGLFRFNADDTLTVIVPPTVSTAIAPSETLLNRLAVTARGNTGQITLEINGSSLGTWNDPTLSGLTWSGVAMAPYDDHPVADGRFAVFRVSPATAMVPFTLDAPPTSWTPDAATPAGWPTWRPLWAPSR